MKVYTLIGADGRTYESPNNGALGGHRGMKLYGRLDCVSALRAFARGHYAKQRAFFVDEVTAIAAEFPAIRMPIGHDRWPIWRWTAARSGTDCCAKAQARRKGLPSGCPLAPSGRFF